MGIPIIGYDNVFEDGNITVTSEASGFEKENAIDWLGYDSWKPTSSGTVTYAVHLGYQAPVDFVGIAFHDLGTQGATVTLQYNDGGGWTNAHTALTPTDDSVIFQTFTEVEVEDYRLEVQSPSSPSSIGILVAGNQLAMPRNFNVGFEIPLFNAFEALGNLSENNTTLGRSIINRPQRQMLNFKGLTEAWVRANWDTFITHAKSKPFFLQWDSERYSSEVALCYTTGNIRNPSYISQLHHQASLECDLFI